MNPIEVAMRWLHIMGAIVAAGGTIFALAALSPALRGLADDVRADIHERVRRRFAMLLGMSILALLVSGFYNYITVEMPQHKGQGQYHALMGGKILLALAVFFVGSALTGRAKAFEKLRQRRTAWLGLNALLVAIIVAFGAVLGKMPVVVPAG